MPVATTYPGVYVTEVPSGVRTITGVATSITAFVGRAARGPIDVATTINAFGDFERVFGGLWASSSLGYAIRDFYLNGGSQAIVVRLDHPTYATDALRTKAVDAATATAAAGQGADAAAAAAAARAKANGYANEPEKSAADTVADAAEAAAGAGPSVADVEKAADDAAAAEGGNQAALDTAAAATGADAAAAAAAARAKADTYTTDPDKTAAGHVATAAESAAAAGASAADVQAAAKAAAATAAPRARAVLEVETGFELEAASPGSWGNGLRARVDHDVLGDDAADLFNLYVRDDTSGLVEAFRNVSMKQDHVRRVDKVLANQSTLVVADAPGAGATRLAASADPDRSLGESDVWADNKVATNASVAPGGRASDGTWLTSDEFIGTGKEDAKQGLYALRQADLFNLLCLPPYLESGDVDASLVTVAAAYCEKRRAVLLVDPPTAWTDKDKAKAGLPGLGTASKNAAIYFPRLRQPDPLRGNQVGDFVPCGAVAGIFARTDTNRGVWKAPAGLDATLVGVPALAVGLTDAENGELNPLGVNCLRTMPAAGRVVWGARTLQGDDRLASEWKYVPVRRTALFIEESLYRGTQWVVFEPNDEPLWAQIRLNLGAFMHNLFRQGAFQGTTPQQAYFVKCDKETTTQNDIDLGVVNIVVGFAPLKPAEFVVISIQQIAGQIEV